MNQKNVMKGVIEQWMIEGFKFGFARLPSKFYQAMANARCICYWARPLPILHGKRVRFNIKFWFICTPMTKYWAKGNKITWSMSWQKPRISYARRSSSSLRLCTWSLLARFFCEGMCAHNFFLFLEHLCCKDDPTWKSFSFF